MARESFYAMGTMITLSTPQRDKGQALADARRCIQTLSNQLSEFEQQSEISELNRAGEATLGEDALAVLEGALEIARETGGAYDPTVLPLKRLWNISNEHDDRQPPEDEEVRRALALVGYDRVRVQGERATLQEGQGIDLGGISKGYAADRAAQILEQAGVRSAIVSLGGNTYVLGTNPDGSPWRVGILDPRGDEAALRLDVSDTAVVTSGDYQQYFEADGVRYHHIFDPHTGYPAQSDLMSVSIVCENAMRADGLSTAVFVMGREKGLAFVQQQPGVEAVLITKDKAVYASPGIRDKITVLNAAYTLKDGQ